MVHTWWLIDMEGQPEELRENFIKRISPHSTKKQNKPKFGNQIVPVSSVPCGEQVR